MPRFQLTPGQVLEIDGVISNVSILKRPLVLIAQRCVIS